MGVEFSPEEVQIYIGPFREFNDVFTWSCEEIPGIYPSIVKNEIKLYENYKTVGKKLRWSTLGRQQLSQLRWRSCLR